MRVERLRAFERHDEKELSIAVCDVHGLNTGVKHLSASAKIAKNSGWHTEIVQVIRLELGQRVICELRCNPTSDFRPFVHDSYFGVVHPISSSYFCIFVVLSFVALRLSPSLF